MTLSSVYLALVDPVRQRILALLAANGPLCVSELQALLTMQQVAVSKQLAYLRAKGVVTTERAANRVYYSIRENEPALSIQIDALIRCRRDSPESAPDQKALERLRRGDLPRVILSSKPPPPVPLPPPTASPALSSWPGADASDLID